MVLQGELRAEPADPVSHDAHADLAIGDGFPGAGRFFGGRFLVEALDLRRLGLGRGGHAPGRGPQADVLQKRAP